MGFSTAIHPSSSAGRIQTRVHDPIQIAGREWRWLITVSIVLVLIGLVPLFLSAAAAGNGDWRFMGLAHNYRDGASYLAKMQIGVNGGWMLRFLHTPDAHDGALTMVLYPALGHLARLTGLSTIVVFHLARVVAALAMYASLYALAASLWMSVSARRLFFIIAALGAGFGWLLAPMTGRVDFPDLTIPEIFPFASTLVNPHFPLAIACLALLAAQFVLIIRPDEPVWSRFWWIGTALLSLGLAMLYPQGLVPFAGAVVLYLLVWRVRRGPLTRHGITYVFALIAPSIPVAIYLGAVVRLNPAFAEWNAQNVTPAPPLWVLLAGLGFPLIIGIPAMVRAARHMDRDGDRLMLFWLLAMLVFIFLPTNIQRRFSVGMMLPVAFFAVRAIRHFWIPKLGKRTRKMLGAIVLTVMTLSNLLILIIPAATLAGGDSARIGLALPAAYSEALSDLENRATLNDVILAAPDVSIWIPGISGARVVFGHPYETLQAEAREAAVGAWYRLPEGPDCQATLQELGVTYVLFGPLEAHLGEGACVAGLEPVQTHGPVTVYAVPAS